MKYKTGTRKTSLFNFQSAPDPIAKEDSLRFREFAAEIDRDLQRLEDRMRAFQQPARAAAWKYR